MGVDVDVDADADVDVEFVDYATSKDHLVKELTSHVEAFVWCSCDHCYYDRLVSNQTYLSVLGNLIPLLIFQSKIWMNGWMMDGFDVGTDVNPEELEGGGRGGGGEEVGVGVGVGVGVEVGVGEREEVDFFIADQISED